MKRLLCFALCLSLIFAVGCGEKKVNKSFDEQTVRAYKNTIATLDSLLNNDISQERAADKIKDFAASVSGTSAMSLDSVATLIDSMALKSKVDATGSGDKPRLSSADYDRISQAKKNLEKTLYR